MDSAADVAARLGATGYLADDELATVVFLAARMQRPLLARGRAGHGQDRAGRGARDSLELPLVRLQCYEGIDASQALYDWDFPRQILHLRALEAVAATSTSTRRRRASTTSGSCWRGRCSRRCGRRPRCC